MTAPLYSILTMHPPETTSKVSHWSKEYVEHLRSVHFALIAVCSGLIILMLSASRYSQEDAKRQLKQLASIQKGWNPILLESPERFSQDTVRQDRDQLSQPGVNRRVFSPRIKP